ncbi:hypothetical protein CEXT_697461 [Caerostris extrusa]|uniref:Uncharacterized protein n=1 Tax=Caerostris extrusa TaxID=172846 RepID=A0AAV4Y2B4_CAEEX|nr:hypothetical protein CEXT_697461 [Caerostris extrusa]
MIPLCTSKLDTCKSLIRRLTSREDHAAAIPLGTIGTPSCFRDCPGNADRRSAAWPVVNHAFKLLCPDARD